MKLNRLVFSCLLAGAVAGVGSGAHAYVWTVTDEGANYKLTPELSAGGALIPHYWSMVRTAGHISPSIVHDRGADWAHSKALIRHVAESGCGRSIFGVACAETAISTVSSVASASAAVGQLAVSSAQSSSNSTNVASIGAMHNDPNGDTGSGMAKVTSIPETKLYAMMLAGLGLMGFVAQRRKQDSIA